MLDLQVRSGLRCSAVNLKKLSSGKFIEGYALSACGASVASGDIA
jgi:hypothetical protein